VKVLEVTNIDCKMGNSEQMLGKKVHYESGQNLKQIAQRNWRYTMFHCDLKLKLNIAWRLAIL